jgi:hypothetical protein
MSFLAEKKHLAENEQLAETYICFYTFRPVAKSNIFFLRFGQWPNRIKRICTFRPIIFWPKRIIFLNKAKFRGFDFSEIETRHPIK